jgi:hypothetical protein
MNKLLFLDNKNENYKVAVIFAAVSAYLEDEKMAAVMAAIQTYLEQERINQIKATNSSIANWRSAYRRIKAPVAIRWGYPSLNRF